jgi:NAD(P)H-dependent FMN reductase
LQADGYIFATPENLAAMSGVMKDFFDRTYYAALDRIAGRPYAVLICAGSDGANAARQVERIVTGWRLKRAAPTLIVLHPGADCGNDITSQDDQYRRSRPLHRDWRDSRRRTRFGNLLGVCN